MDQGPLVTEQMDAGAKLAYEFTRRIPLQAAFWLKAVEDGKWFLYLASDQINDSKISEAYDLVNRIFGPGPHLWLDPMQVKVTGTDQPLARGVIELQQQYPGLLPMRLRTFMLGGVYVEEVFIYPLPVPVPG